MALLYTELMSDTVPKHCSKLTMLEFSYIALSLICEQYQAVLNRQRVTDYKSIFCSS